MRLRIALTTKGRSYCTLLLDKKRSLAFHTNIFLPYLCFSQTVLLQIIKYVFYIRICTENDFRKR